MAEREQSTGASSPRTFMCAATDFHPYECDGPGECVHCDRRATIGHDPAGCALCDPECDGSENPAYGPGNPDWEHDRDHEAGDEGNRGDRR